MFPDSTRPLRREQQLKNFRKTKYGATEDADSIKSSKEDSRYARNELKKGTAKSARREVTKTGRKREEDEGRSSRKSRANTQEKLSVKSKRKKSATSARKSGKSKR